MMWCCLVRDPSSAPAPGGLEAVARACSPRVAPCGDDAVIFDAAGLSRVLGPPAAIAREVVALAGGQALTVRIAIAGTLTSAWILAHARQGPTIVRFGREAEALAPLPLGWLGVMAAWDSPALATATATMAAGIAGSVTARDTPALRPSSRRRGGGRGSARHYRMAPGPQDEIGPPVVAVDEAIVRDRLAICERWGLRTLGDLAALPRADVHARLGAAGVRLHQAACGEDQTPFRSSDPRVRFCERRELEWPIDGLEPLTFVLGGLCDALSTSLERADRGAIAITTRLRLVTRETHARTLHLPAPMRDAKVLRTLITLDLETHPPPAGIDVVEVDVDVAPGRIAQGSLLARTLPAPEALATLVARLGAIAGDARVGAPRLVDSHDERDVALAPFAPRRDLSARTDPGPRGRPGLCLRRFRLPIAARVAVERGVPVRVAPAARGLPGGLVTNRAGPWRSSGRWWSLDTPSWDRDEWDVEIAASGLYRIARDRGTGLWTIEAILD